jgi:hypothetical protein
VPIIKSAGVLHFGSELRGGVGTEIVTAGAQLAGGQHLVADIVQELRLHRVDVCAPAAVEFVVDDIEQTPMQALDQDQRFQIMRPDMVEARLAFGRARPSWRRFSC